MMNRLFNNFCLNDFAYSEDTELAQDGTSC